MENVCTFEALVLIKGSVLVLPIILFEALQRFVIPNDRSVWLLDQANGFLDCLPTQSLHSKHH